MGQVLLNGVLPIFAIAAIGYFMGMRGIFDAGAAAVINKLVFLVAVPALGFQLIVNAPFAAFQWYLLVGFFASELCIYILGFLFARLILKCEMKEALLLGLAASFGNALMFVLPIAIALYGEAAALPIVAIVALDSIVIFGGTIIVMEAISAGDFSVVVIVKKIFQNPPLISMLVAISVVLLSIEIHHGLNVFLKFTGNMAAPCSLFSLGIVLSRTKITDRIFASSCLSIIKLVGHPIIAWIILSGILDFTLSDAKTSMMVAAAPCGAMAFVLALNYQVRTDVIAPAIFFTTLGSLASVTLVASL
jgi:predicted permease